MPIQNSRSTRLFLERGGIRATVRGPLPRLALGLNGLDVLVEAATPRPWAAPDARTSERSVIEIWPHADSEEPQ